METYSFYQLYSTLQERKIILALWPSLWVEFNSIQLKIFISDVAVYFPKKSSTYK